MTKKIVNMHTMKLKTMSDRKSQTTIPAQCCWNFQGMDRQQFHILIGNNQYLLMAVHKINKLEQLSGIQPDLFSSQLK